MQVGAGGYLSLIQTDKMITLFYINCNLPSLPLFFAFYLKKKAVIGLLETTFEPSLQFCEC